MDTTKHPIDDGHHNHPVDFLAIEENSSHMQFENKLHGGDQKGKKIFLVGACSRYCVLDRISVRVGESWNHCQLSTEGDKRGRFTK